MKRNALLFLLSYLVISSVVFPFDLDDFVIKSRLFKSTGTDIHEASDVIVSIYSVPVLVPYNPNYIQLEKINIHHLKTDIQKIYKIDRIDHLSSGLMIWDGNNPKMDGIIVVKESSYPLSFSPSMLEQGEFSLRIRVSQPRDSFDRSSSGKDLLDTEMVMRMDTPYVLGFPSNGSKYFLAISVAKKEAGKYQKENYSRADPEKDIPQMPTPVQKIIPTYPPQLKKDKIGGKVILQVTIDKEGNVSNVNTLNSAHPDLSRAAKSSLYQWKFAPIEKKNKPVSVSFPVIVEFRSNS
jgi:TonB family protein